MSGAVAGGALAALLSAIHYNKERKNEKKQSFAKRFLKSLIWTGLGAAGGGILGSGLGRAIGNHVQYNRNLELAKKLIRDNGMKKRTGRVLYLNYPENTYSGKLLGFLSKVFPNGVPVQHGALLTMDEDGGNAKIFQASALVGDQNKDFGHYVVGQGLELGDRNMIISGARGLSGEINRGLMQVSSLRNSLKGKTDSEIARILADYGKSNGMGDVVEISEGKRNVDINLPEVFAKIDTQTENGPSGSGYGFMPGRYNCGTAARRMYSTVNGRKDHILDLLWGGFPGDNAPSMATKTVGHSHALEKREDKTPRGMPDTEFLY